MRDGKCSFQDSGPLDKGKNTESIGMEAGRQDVPQIQGLGFVYINVSECKVKQIKAFLQIFCYNFAVIFCLIYG